MSYTEFRKSYGDFEIVIPAIDIRHRPSQGMV